jgi:hypothetical protein
VPTKIAVAFLPNKAVQAQTDLNFIEKERKEPPRTWPWKAAVEQFNASAQQVASAHFAITFKQSDFPLPQGDWSLCVNRVALLKTIDAELGRGLINSQPLACTRFG